MLLRTLYLDPQSIFQLYHLFPWLLYFVILFYSAYGASVKCIVNQDALQLCGIFLHSINYIFSYKELFFIFWCLSCSLLASILLKNGIQFIEFCFMPVSCRVLPIFSSVTFSVLGFKLRILIHLELIVVQVIEKGSISFFSMNIQFSQHELLKILSFLQRMCFCFFVKYQTSVDLSIHVSVFHFVPLI